ncbi:MAG: acetyl-CoA hydrolase/transferase C-terminal domain-containing protein [Desulfatiglandales bacterium]
MKYIDAKEILDIIGPDAKIGLGNACAEPQTLIDCILDNTNYFNQLKIYGMIHYWTKLLDPLNQDGVIKLNLFMLDKYTASGVIKGYSDYIPCRYSKIPSLFLDGIIKLDVALISVSPPDRRGRCSFGVSNDFTQAMAKTAIKTIAEINYSMPIVYGDSWIDINDIDFIVESDRKLPQIPSPGLNDIDRKIGAYVSELVEDRATIQVGIGRLSEAALASLTGKKRLGVHSGLLPDGIVDLVKEGVIDNTCKGLKEGRIVTTTIIGTDKIFDFVNNNKEVESYPSNYTHNEMTIARVNKLNSINSAIQIDFTGQINAETISGVQVSGVGGQTDFVCGAALSKGGKSIVLITSTSKGGKKSRIVPFLDSGSAVTSLRHDIDYVISEYGIAELKGKTMRDRADALIAIAHPNFQELLERERHRLFPSPF